MRRCLTKKSQNAVVP